MSSDLAPHALAAGTQIRDYTIMSVIGMGGFSIVYKALDNALQREVAIKEYFPGALALRDAEGGVHPHSRDRATFSKGIESFLNEGKLLAAFDHPALLRVYRCWEERGTAYLAMRLYTGITLRDAVLAGQWHANEESLHALLAPLCDALDLLHASHCYHRDVAPDNIMLVDVGARVVPVLLDFGAARKAIESTQVFTAILKPGYAPIEQYGDGELKQGPWTDIYALAGVVHFTLAGSAPPTAVSRMIKDVMPRPRDAFGGRLPEHWLDAIETALAVKPDLRPVNISAFRELFRWDETQTLPVVVQPEARAAMPAASSALDDERTVVAVRPVQRAPAAVIAPAQPAPPAASRRKFAVTWAAMLAIVVVIGVTATLLLDKSPREPGGNPPGKAAAMPTSAPTSAPTAPVAPSVAPPTEIKAGADTFGAKKTSLPSEPVREAAPPVQEPALEATREQLAAQPPKPVRQKQAQTGSEDGRPPATSGARPARCGSLIERFGLGELLNTEEQQFIRERCK